MSTTHFVQISACWDEVLLEVELEEDISVYSYSPVRKWGRTTKIYPITTNKLPYARTLGLWNYCKFENVLLTKIKLPEFSMLEKR